MKLRRGMLSFQTTLGVLAKIPLCEILGILLSHSEASWPCFVCYPYMEAHRVAMSDWCLDRSRRSIDQRIHRSGAA